MRVRTLVSVFVALVVGAAQAHDLEGLRQELTDPAVGALADPATQLRLRVFQATGLDPDAATAAAGEFGRVEGDDIEQVFLRNYLWPQRKILRVCFFDGSASQRQAVVAVIDEVLSHTNLGAMVSTRSCPIPNSDIQIRFASGGCFSYYGRTALTVLAGNRGKHTIGLCNVRGGSERDRGIIRHEFMHALGAVHEQQHDGQRCYDQLDLARTGAALFPGSDAAEREAQVRVNLLSIRDSVPGAQVATLPYDRSSVMHYRLPSDYFRNPATATCVLAQPNNALSPGDRRILSQMYPPRR